jgi:Protein of unknown function (DUF2637)
MTLANGHANGTAIPGLTPFTVHQAGPALSWPPPPPEQPRDMTVTEEVTAAVRDSIDGDKVIRLLTAFVVLAVAAFAAVVSYSHIFDLGHLHGQDGTAARLLPLSVDGLIAAASLVMLHAARNKLPVPPLSRLMLALGVGATVAANVAYGLPFGWLSAVVSAWPAAAFVGSVEMAIRFVTDARSVATASATEDAGPGDSDSDTSSDKDSDKDSDDQREDRDEEQSPPPPPPDPPDPRRRQKAPSGGDKVRAILKRNPGLAKDVVAKRAGVSERTVERVMRELAEAKS